MTDVQIKETTCKVFGQVVPKADLEALAPDENIRQAPDIDSFDHLNLLISLHEALGVDILEADYCRLTTLSDIIGYLSVRVP